MQDSALPIAFGLFPFVFLLFWLGITTALMAVAGWPALAARFPDRPDEPARLRLSMQTGRMGPGVQFRGVLRLDACRSGLRIGVLRIFAPFHRPVLVPWAQIETAPARMFLWSGIRLGLGRPEAGSLVIGTRAWERLSAHRG